MVLPIMTFLSYSEEDKKIAKKLAEKLEAYNFEIFVAHEDIPIGTIWEEKLKNEIYNRELFIFLLSKNFKSGSFTDHEVGIATAYNKRIFPIIIDKTVPYGFMSKFQGKNINPEIDEDEISKLANELKLFSQEGKKEIDELIEQLLNSRSWTEANAIARKLFKFTTFTPDQINNIAEAYVENFEVNGSWTAGPKSAEFLSKNWNIVEQRFKKELSEKLQK